MEKLIRACDVDDEWEICSGNSDACCYDDDEDEGDEFKRNTEVCLNCPYNDLMVEEDDN